MLVDDVRKSSIPVTVNLKGEEVIEVLEHETIPIREFVTFFYDSGVNFSELVNHPNITPRWKQVFEKWKQKSILD